MSLHDHEVKVRLREKHKDLLHSVSQIHDSPPAVLARQYLLVGMYAELKRLGIVDANGNEIRSPTK